MQDNPGFARGTSEAAREGKRLERAGPLVDPAAEIGTGTDQPFDIGGIEQFDRSAHIHPVSCPLLDTRECRRSVGSLNPPAPLRIAIDTMFCDPVENDVGCIADRFSELPANGRTVFRGHLGRIVFQTRNDLPAIAPGGTPADRLGFQQHHRCTGFGRIQGRRTAGNAGADDCEVDAAVTGERIGSEGRLVHGRRPERSIMAFGRGPHPDRHSAAILEVVQRAARSAEMI